MNRIYNTFYRPGNQIHAAGVIIIVIVVLLLYDYIFKIIYSTYSLQDKNVIIFSKNILENKIDILSKHKGLRIAAIGDSLIVGKTMQKRGQNNWKENNFTGLLEKYLKNAIPTRSPMVINCGLDGAVPSDYEQVAKMLINAKPEMVIMDCSIRSFSSDFSVPGNRYTRSWLIPEIKNENIFTPQALNYKIENALSYFLKMNLELYRFRDYLQSFFLDNPLRIKLENIRDNYLIPGNMRLKVDDDLLMLLKIKMRFAGINFNFENPQLQAMKRTLLLFKENNINTLIFYATEEKKLLFSIVEPEIYYDMKNKFEKELSEFIDDKMKYYPGYDKMPSERYIDYAHLDEKGYILLLEYLRPCIDKILKIP